MKNRAYSQVVKSKSGFTLIETLVVATIIMLLTGLIITNYISFIERNRVRTAAEEARNFLSDIQNRARMGHRGSGRCGVAQGGITRAYQVRGERIFLDHWFVILEHNHMRAYVACRIDGELVQEREQVVHLPQGAIFVRSPGQALPQFIHFPALYRNPRGDIGQDIVVTDANRRGYPLYNYFYVFNITGGGAISTGDFCTMGADGICVR